MSDAQPGAPRGDEGDVLRERPLAGASAFESHEVCSSSEWLNGQSDPLSESYHPNISGHAEFTSLIEAVL